MYCSNCRAALYPNATGCHQCGAVFYLRQAPAQPAGAPQPGQSPYGQPGFTPPQFTPPPYPPSQVALQGAPYGQYGASPDVMAYMNQGMPAPRPMGFGRAVSTCFSKYATFRGRGSRAEYWWFYLFLCLYFIALAVVGAVVGTAAFAGSDGDGASALVGLGVVWIIFGLGSLPILVPSLSAAVRRLHDTDRSGWWMLLNAIPFIGPIVVLVFLILPGTSGPNRFGLAAD